MNNDTTCSLKQSDNDDQSNSKEDSKSTNNDKSVNGKTAIDETLPIHSAFTKNSDHDLVEEQLARDGFAFVKGSVMANLLQENGFNGWDEFASSWNDLLLDNYMADGGQYRRRRYSALRMTRDAMIRLPPQPFRQSKKYNTLNGGVDRWYEPIRDEIMDGAAMQSLLYRCCTWFSDLSPNVAAWYVDVHQYRVEALGEDAGKPTPEGIHRDGADWVLAFMINYHNIEGGMSTIYDHERRPLASCTLAEPFDLSLLNDHRVLHDVSSVKRHNPDQVAYRDVLVINFQEKDTLW
jgi:hypothetical protein